MDIQVLTDDLTAVLKEIFPEKLKTPSLMLVGHSMVRHVLVRTNSFADSLVCVTGRKRCSQGLCSYSAAGW